MLTCLMTYFATLQVLSSCVVAFLHAALLVLPVPLPMRRWPTISSLTCIRVLRWALAEVLPLEHANYASGPGEGVMAGIAAVCCDVSM